MSLLTDALRLREGRLSRRENYPIEPPLGRPKVWRWILYVAVGCVFAVWLILHWEELCVKAEELAGIKSLKPGPEMAWKIMSGRQPEVSEKPAAAPATPPAVVAGPKQEKKKPEPDTKVASAEAPATPAAVVAEPKQEKKKPEPDTKVASAEAPATPAAVVAEPKQEKKKPEPDTKVALAEAPATPAAAVTEDGSSRTEEVKVEEAREEETQGEEVEKPKPVVAKSAPAGSVPRLKLEKAAPSASREAKAVPSKAAAGEGEKPAVKTAQAPVAKKPGDGPAVRKPVLKKRVAPAVAVDRPAVAEVPAGGLQPMKVELAEMEAVMETPQERDKKRTDQVEIFLRSLQVQGVRLQGKESRILVDGVPIGLGEKVGSLGLVLESVESQKIIFSDVTGKKYPKSY